MTMEQPQQPKPSAKRAPKGFEIALASLCALLVSSNAKGRDKNCQQPLWRPTQTQPELAIYSD
jgi:hypothetical protein